MSADAEAPLNGAPAVFTHRQVMTIFSGLLLAMFLAALDQTIVATALPTMVTELGGLAHLSWVVTAYMLASTVSAPIYGKLSDLYGRRLLLQIAIGIFLLGSTLAGTSQSMAQLIGWRGVQGAGAGGMMVLAQAVIGDIVTPRQRGRYQGYLGSVFAVSSIFGPLLGGFCVSHLSWRWVFYINIPLGAIALLVIQRSLRLVHHRREHRIDYAGALLLGAALTCLLLMTVSAGCPGAWLSPRVIGLGLGALVAGAAFIAVEKRATEPILPLEIFAKRVVKICSALGAILGVGMFGAIIFMPLFMQIVVGVSPTASGLMLLPLMGGAITSSIVSGILISRHGRYRIFPILGTALMTVGYVCLSRMDTETGLAGASVAMALVGFGMGMVIQVLVLITQNAVDFKHLGAATSAAQLFRSIGGTLGIAIFGSVMNAGLASGLVRYLPEGASLPLPPEVLLRKPDLLATLSPPVVTALRHALADGITHAFALAIPLAALAVVIAFFIDELPLRDHHGEA